LGYLQYRWESDSEEVVEVIGKSLHHYSNLRINSGLKFQE